MSDQPPVEKPKPVTLRPAPERYAHVAQRLRERGSVEWTPEQVQVLEKKIKMVRTMVNLHKLVAPILPTKIGEDKGGIVHFYRVLIAGERHTFVWSQICRGLISYRGLGDLNTPTSQPHTPGQDPVAGIHLGPGRYRDLSGCDPV